jgi:hypothetical protein
MKMSVEAHRCNEKSCKGFIVFENADFDYNSPPTVDGMYEFDNPTCTECGKEYKVVPYHAVIALDEHGDIEEVQSACITEWERREKERKVEGETDPYQKIEKFIQLRGYSYSVEDVFEGFVQKMNGYYVSYTMKDCVENLSSELKSINVAQP